MAGAVQTGWEWLKGRLRGHGFEAATAVGWAFVGVAYIAGDDKVALHSPVGHAVHPYEFAWAVMYVVGGMLALAGLASCRVELRVAGLALLAAGLVMEGSAAAYYDPDARIGLYAIYAVACIARAAVAVTEETRRRQRRERQG